MSKLKLPLKSGRETSYGELDSIIGGELPANVQGFIAHFKATYANEPTAVRHLRNGNSIYFFQTIAPWNRFVFNELILLKNNQGEIFAAKNQHRVWNGCTIDFQEWLSTKWVYDVDGFRSFTQN
ncbi:MAG: hypothetical protein FWB72_00390 [Firmicutes bacterium]|nr:hypothetical protein [Bacillota bacterium]